MTLPDINFLAIRAHDGSRNAGFEELCCQLASLESRAPTAQFFRKGRGGDAGVECFVRTADGNETGWQAKYVLAWNPTLARQLDLSIETALEKHPKLKIYFVCLPFDLPDARAGRGKTPRHYWEAWREKWIKAAKAQKRKLRVELWSKSDLAERLARDIPAYAGRLAYWLDQESFTSAWFKHQFEKARAALGSRYSPETNVDLPIRRDFLGFSRDPNLNLTLHNSSVKLQEGSYSAMQAVNKAAGKKSSHETAIELGLRSMVLGFSALPISPDQLFPISDWCDSAGKLRETVRGALDWVYDLPSKRNSKMGTSPIQWARHCLFQISDTLGGLIEDLNSERWKLANNQAILLYGNAGTGKSHLLADVVEHHIASGYPGVLVLGSTFVDGEPWRQILTQLDLPVTLQTKHFLAAMDAAAQEAGVRAIICIDAINERNGMDVWPSRLAAFLKEIRPFPHIGVVLSCRSTYLRQIIPESISQDDLYRIEHKGFSGHASEAAKVYLDKRGIVRPGAPNLVPEFENPLFLKTCCDYLEKDGKRELPRGLTGVTEIFGFYVDAVARALNLRMKLDQHLDVVQRAIRALALAITAKGTGYIEKPKAIALLDAIHPSHNELERSLLAQLESEGVIAIEAVLLEDGTHSDEVRFTFERFSDHQIAVALLDRHLNLEDIAGSFAPGTQLHEAVVGQDAYRRLGIIEALSIQLPERVGTELFDLLPDAQSRWILRDPFLDSLIWRNQRYITDRTHEILRSITQGNQRKAILLSLATEPNNKFNAIFLHNKLMVMQLPERDQSWTNFVNQYGEDETNSITTLISWSLSNGLDTIDNDRAELAGIALTWLLTASNRAVRDKATKALACLLASRLALAGVLIRKFSSVDDPYVIERLMAASYGAVLQGITLNGTPELAHAVYDTMFVSTPPPNALLRDHASGILQYLDWRDKLPKGIDTAKVNPPYHSAWPIEFVPDELIDTYKQNYGKGEFGDAIVSSTVNDGDFARYQIDYFSHHWTQAPLGSGEAPTNREVALAWMEKFIKSATTQQKIAFEKMLGAAKLLKGINLGYQDTPETLKFKKVERAFRKTLDPNHWEEYRVKAQRFIRYTLFDSVSRRTDSIALFDNNWARRWICKRAHELGWSPERFGEIERYRNGDYGRHEHRIERIGKKYQWLAMYELGARVADNLEMKNDSWGGPEKTQEYIGAWQIGLRNIDPSLLVIETYYDGWKQWPRTWWVPLSPVLHEIPRKERLVWRDSLNDIVNDSRLIDLRDPKSGRQWLALNGFAHWRQSGVEDGHSETQRDTWFRLSCIVAKKPNRSKLLKWLRAQQLTSPHDLPETEFYGDQYLGEYPWHRSFAHLIDLKEPEHWRKLPVAVRTPIVSYSRERGGYDYSIDKTVRMSMPAPWLMKAMDLRLSNGRKLTYISADDLVRFFDPSVSEPGPAAALVDRDEFLALLERENLCAFWIIAGEKNVYSGQRSDSGWGGRLVHTYVYELKDGKFVHYKKVEIEKPNAEQLRAYLEDEPSSAKSVKKAQTQLVARPDKKRKSSKSKKQKSRAKSG